MKRTYTEHTNYSTRDRLVDQLRQALHSVMMERDQWAADCKILKSGVVILNNRNIQLIKDLECARDRLIDHSRGISVFNS